MKVDSKGILDRAEKRRVRAHKNVNMYDRHLWNNLDIGHSFCVSLGECEKSDPRAVKVARGLSVKLQNMKSAWRGMSGVCERTGRKLSEFERQGHRARAGEEATAEMREWSQKGTNTSIPAPEGALKRASIMHSGFEDARKKGLSALGQKPRASYSYARQGARS